MTSVVRFYNGDASVTVPTPVAMRCSVLVLELLDGVEELPAAGSSATESSSASPAGVPSTVHDIPVPTGTQTTLQKMSTYMLQRWNDPPKMLDRPLAIPLLEAVDIKDQEFIKLLSQEEAMDLLSLGIFLNYKALNDLMAAQIADWMKEMTVEGMRTLWAVRADFPAEMIDAMVKEHDVVVD